MPPREAGGEMTGRQYASDFSQEDLAGRLCIVCGLPPGDLLNSDAFPPADYYNEVGAAFWHVETVRAWVQAYAWAKLLCRPRVLQALAEALLLQRAAERLEMLPTEDARVLALHHFSNVLLDRILQP
jgi:hypothetical protein